MTREDALEKAEEMLEKAEKTGIQSDIQKWITLAASYLTLAREMQNDFKSTPV